MIITVDPELEAVLTESARQQGIAPEVLALHTLRKYFLTQALLEPRDEWERGLRALALNCGVSLSNWAVSSEGIYD